MCKSVINNITKYICQIYLLIHIIEFKIVLYICIKWSIYQNQNLTHFSSEKLANIYFTSSVDWLTVRGRHQKRVQLYEAVNKRKYYIQLIGLDWVMEERWGSYCLFIVPLNLLTQCSNLKQNDFPSAGLVLEFAIWRLNVGWES